MKTNTVLNMPVEKQMTLAKMQIITEENIKANRFKSEAIAKINSLCATGISKETRRKKINEIIEHLQKNAEHLINQKEEYRI